MRKIMRIESRGSIDEVRLSIGNNILDRGENSMAVLAPLHFGRGTSMAWQVPHSNSCPSNKLKRTNTR